MTKGIITGLDIARRDSISLHEDWIKRQSEKMRRANILDTPYKPEFKGIPVEAFLDFQRWCARCECGGSEYVTPGEDIFYCFSCGNQSTGGYARKVKFPGNRIAIEETVMERPVKVVRGTDFISRAMSAIASIPRSWTPDITLTQARKDTAKAKKNGI